MAKLVGLKLFLFLAGIFLGVWNYLWRESFSLPFVSSLSSNLVLGIAIGLIVLTIIINWVGGNKEGPGF